MEKTLRLAAGVDAAAAPVGVTVDERVVAAEVAAVVAADTGEGEVVVVVEEDKTVVGETEVARDAAADDGGEVLRMRADVLREELGDELPVLKPPLEMMEIDPDPDPDE